MMPHYPTSRTIAAALLLTLLCACSKPSAPDTAATPSTAAQTTPAPSAASASRLGDLSPFHAIASDVAAMVQKGDLAGAKVRIKDLEVAWDGAEAGLKPRAASDWHVLDKSIDTALAALRADTPSQADSTAALAALLETFETLAGTRHK